MSVPIEGEEKREQEQKNDREDSIALEVPYLCLVDKANYC
jgi:hypothetical protein